MADRKGACLTVAIRLAVAIALAGALAGQARADTACRAQAHAYGIVEIGGKGVKATISELVSAPEGSSGSCDLNVLNEFDALNTDPVDPASRDKTIAAIGQQRDRILAWAPAHHLAIAGNDIFYVLSSGMANLRKDNPAYWNELKERIADKTGEQPAVISAEDEASLTFDGVANVEKCYRRSQVALIDVGSSNTKGAYLNYDPDAPNCTWANLGLQHVTFQIPWGTVTLERKIAASAHGEAAFRTGLETFIADEIATYLTVTVARDGDNKGGFRTRSRVYLAGGIPYTLATFAHPEDRGPDVRLSADDIDDFYADLKDRPACVTGFLDASLSRKDCRLKSRLARIDDPQTRKDVTAEMSDIVRNIFTTQDQLLAGAGLLKAIADQWDFKDRRIFFMRQSRHSWMLGYLLQKFGNRSDVPRQFLPAAPPR